MGNSGLRNSVCEDMERKESTPLKVRAAGVGRVTLAGGTGPGAAARGVKTPLAAAPSLALVGGRESSEEGP